jgi:CheY-like chemotaxis protein/HPt (histidine-containing phosphotransfer) domain-containing protein
LPLREPHGAICERSDAIAPLPSAPFRERLKGLIILLAEDNAANRLVLEEMLNPEGCWLVQVGNGQEAVEHVRRDGAVAFDLVLMDIQMPIMDGYEATRRIRALAPDLAVVGLTAHALPAERERCLGAGMVDHVAKPVDLDTLVAAILRHARRPPKSSASELAPEIWGAAASRRPSGARDVGENQAALDWSALEQRYRESPGFMPRLLQAVLESSQGLAEQLRQAAAGGDASQLGFVAHRVRGMAGNLFADDLVDRAAKTEHSAGNEDLAGAAQQGLALADALDRMLAEIRRSRWFCDAQPAGADGPEPAPIDLERLSRAVEHLLSLLAIDDTKSAAHFDCHEDLLRQAFGEQAQALGLAIKRFDFQGALLLLNNAWRQYKPD